jgi:hypothetical protein
LQQLCEQRERQGNRSAPIAEARALLQVPPEVSQSMTEFTRDPRPLLQHRDRLARMIVLLKRP